MKAQKNTKIMVTCALLVALQVILARFLSINTTFVVVNFSFLAVALSGILFGPLWAQMCIRDRRRRERQDHRPVLSI